MCPPKPTLPGTGVSDTMQLSCAAQGQDSVFLLLQQALSPPNHLPSPVRHTLLKHYLNRAKDMVLLTVLALHAGDSGLDPSTTQLGGEGKN